MQVITCKLYDISYGKVTSAWNTVLTGRKLWLLYPPDTPKAVAKAPTIIGHNYISHDYVGHTSIAAAALPAGHAKGRRQGTRHYRP